MGLSRYGPGTLVRELALILLALVFCLPFYVLVIMSLETTDADVTRTPLSVPAAASVRVTSRRPGTRAGRAGLGTAIEEQPDHHGLERRRC